jgi:hypothetical protein
VALMVSMSFALGVPAGTLNVHITVCMKTLHQVLRVHSTTETAAAKERSRRGRRG